MAGPGGRVKHLWTSRPWLQEGTWLVATMLLSLMVVAWAMQLWDAPLRVPFAPGGDGLMALTSIKDMIENGWYLTNPSLAAPHGQDLFDFAGFGADNLQWGIIKVLSLGIRDPGLLLNAYFLLGFPLVGGSAFIVLRYFRISRPAALVGSVLFAILPYHFAHGEGHLMLSNYFAVPAGCWLILRALLGTPFMKRKRGSTGMRGWCAWGNAGVVVACVLVGGSTLYYAVFTMVLLVLSAVVRTATVRSWRALIPAAGGFAGVGVVLLVNLSPGLIYRAMHGANTVAAVRNPQESEAYSFSLTQLLLPVDAHRLAPLAELRQNWVSKTMAFGENGNQLGFLLAATFVSVLVALCVWALTGSRKISNPLVGAAAVGAFLVFLLGTFGGISSIIAYLISPQIRAWGRLTPFLAFFCVILLALALDWCRRRWAKRRYGVAGGAALLAAVAVVGVLDQTSPFFIPAYTANAAAWQIDANFVQQIEQTVPKGSEILQLPLHPFPEAGPVGTMGDYDHLAGYAHSQGLRWSYGAVKGRPEDWTTQAAGLPIRRLLPAAATAGFAGLWVDRNAYPDHGAGIEASIHRVLGPSASSFISEGGRRVFYDLQPLGRRLRATRTKAQLAAIAHALIEPTMVAYGEGFYQEEGDARHHWRWAARRATLTLTNPGHAVARVRITSVLRGTSGARVVVTEDGKVARTLLLGNGQAPVDLVVPVKPGRTTITLATNGLNNAPPTDPRELYLQLDQLSILDTGLAGAR